MGVPRYAVIYREFGATSDSLIPAHDPDEQGSLIADLLDARGIRGRAVQVDYRDDPTVYRTAAKNRALEIGEQVSDEELEPADALNVLAPIAPDLDDKTRALWLDELVHCLGKAREQSDGNAAAWDRDVDWDGKVAEAAEILAGVRPAPEGVRA